MLVRSLLLLSTFLFSIQAFAYDAKSCEIKKDKLEDQLVYAKKNNNSYRIRSLERALANLKTKCAPYVNEQTPHKK